MTIPQLDVRRATPTDKGAVIALSRAVSVDDYIPEVFDYWMTYSDPEGFFVAEQDGQILGCYCVEFHAPGQAYLYAMRVDPKVQGSGIGSVLCRFQVEQARALGAQEIYLLSVLENERAHRLVEKQGYINRGAWLVYDQVRDLPCLPVGQARPARLSDGAAVVSFRQRQVASPLSDVIASHRTPWAITTASEADWDLSDAVLVEGEEGVAGLMLLAHTDDGLLIRWLDGSPEAAAELLGFAVQEVAVRGLPALSISLPLVVEPLLEPLRLKPEEAFRAYVFHHPKP